MVKKTASLILRGSIVFLAFIYTSCTSVKKVIYLNDLQPADSTALSKAQYNFTTPIQKNDQLWITVGSSNATDLPTLNSGLGFIAGGGISYTGAGLGYLVEADGTIKFPFLGKVKAEGLTRMELENIITEGLKEYTKNPVVNVRYMNYYFTVMGEVLHPGRYSMTTERSTILEAITMAGDLTLMGKSNNILVIREENGKRTTGRINLLSKEIFHSPFYYVKTNDVIYVEPVKSKFFSRGGVPQYLSVVAVSLSLVLTIINVSRR
ncbi:MAG: polysaccharide biosynthesis/export family protein [Ferruginibacter sp.]